MYICVQMFEYNHLDVWMHEHMNMLKNIYITIIMHMYLGDNCFYVFVFSHMFPYVRMPSNLLLNENNLFAFISFNHPQQLHTHTPYDDWAKNEFYTERETQK